MELDKGQTIETSWMNPGSWAGAMGRIELLFAEKGRTVAGRVIGCFLRGDGELGFGYILGLRCPLGIPWG